MDKVVARIEPLDDSSNKLMSLYLDHLDTIDTVTICKLPKAKQERILRLAICDFRKPMPQVTYDDILELLVYWQTRFKNSYVNHTQRVFHDFTHYLLLSRQLHEEIVLDFRRNWKINMRQCKQKTLN